MLALRLARSAALKSATAQRRSLVTATVNHVDVSSAPLTATSSRVAPIPLSNIEAQWAKLSAEEKVSVHEQLELLQQKDWKELSIDEKKACESISLAGSVVWGSGWWIFGPRARLNLFGEHCS